MKILVKYVDFHADNYQGGSGKSFEFQCLVEIPNQISVGNIKSFINEELNLRVINQRSYSTEECKFAIQSMEIL